MHVENILARAELDRCVDQARGIFVQASFNNSTKLDLVAAEYLRVHVRLEADIVFICPVERSGILQKHFLHTCQSEIKFRVQYSC